MGQDDTLDLRQFGLSLDQLVTNEYIFRQALKTGYTSAITTLVLQLAPEIFKSIDYLIKSGEIDKEQLEKTGLTLLSASSEGFIRGSVSSALTIAYMSGRLGTVLSGIGEDAIPGVIGSMTVIVIDAIKDSVRVASGKMAYEEMGEHLLRSIIVSASGVAAGTLMQTLLTGAPTLGYMLGSFVGSAVASLVVDSAEKAFISVCINTGFTFFGLVKQDYALPESLIKDMGLDCFDFKTFESESFKPESFEFRSFEFQTFKFETIDIKVLKRGLVSVSTIGYVLD
jgi:hypothetical protein